MSIYLVVFVVGEYKGKFKLMKFGVNVSKFVVIEFEIWNM